jgi:hypothetical protein
MGESAGSSTFDARDAARRYKTRAEGKRKRAEEVMVRETRRIFKWLDERRKTLHRFSLNASKLKYMFSYAPGTFLVFSC